LWLIGHDIFISKVKQRKKIKKVKKSFLNLL